MGNIKEEIDVGMLPEIGFTPKFHSETSDIEGFEPFLHLIS